MKKEWYEAKGTLRYSPQRLGGEESQKWWLVIDCQDDISEYYRHVIHIESYKTLKLQKPYWGSHITVIRNEEPPNQELWKKYDGQEIVFKYGNHIGTNYSPERWKSFWWLDSRCEWALDIREELGLRREPYPQFHLTIGNITDEQNRRDFKLRDLHGRKLS